MKIQSRWLLWQVIIPLFAPVILSVLVIGLWATGTVTFEPKWSVVVDISPWALVFFSLTLLGATLNELWPRVSSHPTLTLNLALTAFAVALYAAFIAIWRHDVNWKPGPAVYWVTGALFVLAVALSHYGYAKAKE